MLSLTIALLGLLNVVSIATDQTCNAGANCAGESNKNVVTGFSVFKARAIDHEAFKQDLRSLISVSRSEPGVVSYNMYENPMEPGTFGFVEQWEPAALEAHLKGDNVRKIFTHQYYKDIKVSSQLYGPWVEVPSQPKPDDMIDMTFYWDMDCPRKYIWDILTDLTNASWAIGSPKAEIIDKVNKIQRRTWANGLVVDVRMAYENEENFTAVEQTVGGWKHNIVTFDPYFATMSLSDEGVDPETTTRYRYNLRATMAKGTFDQGRQILKDEFFGPRINWYKKYFNCSHAVHVKRGLTSVQKLHTALSGSSSESSLRQSVAPFFEFAEDKSGSSVVTASSYAQQILKGISSKDSFYLQVRAPVAPMSFDNFQVAAVEDVFSSTVQASALQSRVAIYKCNEFGKIVNARVFDQSAEDVPCNNVLRASDHFYDVVAIRDARKLQNLFSSKATLEFPVGSEVNATTFTDNFFAKVKSVSRSSHRTYILGNQVAQVVEIHDASDKTSTAIHVLTFDANLEVTHFESFSK